MERTHHAGDANDAQIADDAAHTQHTQHTPTIDRYASERVRHDLVRRTLQVVRTEYVATNLLRITLSGDELHGFVSAAFDDHVKIFLPKPGERIPTLPSVEDIVNKRFVPGSERPIARDYTPRRYDAVTNELDIEFVIHGDGPGSSWAAQAKVGDPLIVAGPRGSFIVSDNFDWYLLVGDETAFPAIARRIETLPADASALVIISATDAASLPTWAGQAHPRPNVRVLSVLSAMQSPAHADDALLEAVRKQTLPTGIGHAWVAAESTTAKHIRQHLVAERGFDKHHIRAASYWRQGEKSFHEALDD